MPDPVNHCLSCAWRVCGQINTAVVVYMGDRDFIECSNPDTLKIDQQLSVCPFLEVNGAFPSAQFFKVGDVF